MLKSYVVPVLEFCVKQIIHLCKKRLKFISVAIERITSVALTCFLFVNSQ
jgi:hypothetical protein